MICTQCISRVWTLLWLSLQKRTVPLNRSIVWKSRKIRKFLLLLIATGEKFQGSLLQASSIIIRQFIEEFYPTPLFHHLTFTTCEFAYPVCSRLSWLPQVDHGILKRMYKIRLLLKSMFSDNSPLKEHFNLRYVYGFTILRQNDTR